MSPQGRRRVHIQSASADASFTDVMDGFVIQETSENHLGVGDIEVIAQIEKSLSRQSKNSDDVNRKLDEIRRACANREFTDDKKQLFINRLIEQDVDKLTSPSDFSHFLKIISQFFKKYEIAISTKAIDKINQKLEQVEASSIKISDVNNILTSLDNIGFSGENLGLRGDFFNVIMKRLLTYKKHNSSSSIQMVHFLLHAKNLQCFELYEKSDIKKLLDIICANIDLKSLGNTTANSLAEIILYCREVLKISLDDVDFENRLSKYVAHDENTISAIQRKVSEYIVSYFRTGTITSEGQWVHTGKAERRRGEKVNSYDIADVITISLEGKYGEIATKFIKSADIVIRDKKTKEILGIVEVDGPHHFLHVKGKKSLTKCATGRTIARNALINSLFPGKFFCATEDDFEKFISHLLSDKERIKSEMDKVFFAIKETIDSRIASYEEERPAAIETSLREVLDDFVAMKVEEEREEPQAEPQAEPKAESQAVEHKRFRKPKEEDFEKLSDAVSANDNEKFTAISSELNLVYLTQEQKSILLLNALKRGGKSCAMVNLLFARAKIDINYVLQNREYDSVSLFALAAIESDDPDFVRFLIKEKGADVNKLFSQIVKRFNPANKNITVLEYAIIHGSTEIISVLLEAIKDQNGEIDKSLQVAALEIAAMYNYRNFEFLVQKGFDINLCVKKDIPVISLLFDKKDRNIIKSVLRYEIDPEILNLSLGLLFDDGMSKTEDLDIAAMILEKPDIDINKLVYNNTVSPIRLTIGVFPRIPILMKVIAHSTQNENSGEIIKFLIEKGAKNVILNEEYNFDILTYIMFCGCDENGKMVESTYKCFKILFENNFVDVNRKYKIITNCAHKDARGDKVSIIQYLIARNVVDENKLCELINIALSKLTSEEDKRKFLCNSETGYSLLSYVWRINDNLTGKVLKLLLDNGVQLTEIERSSDSDNLKALNRYVYLARHLSLAAASIPRADPSQASARPSAAADPADIHERVP